MANGKPYRVTLYGYVLYDFGFPLTVRGDSCPGMAVRRRAVRVSRPRPSTGRKADQRWLAGPGTPGPPGATNMCCSD